MMIKKINLFFGFNSTYMFLAVTLSSIIVFSVLPKEVLYNVILIKLTFGIFVLQTLYGKFVGFRFIVLF